MQPSPGVYLLQRGRDAGDAGSEMPGPQAASGSVGVALRVRWGNDLVATP